MNGGGRGAATGAAMLWRPGADFGPSWPEVASGLVRQKGGQKRAQKNTFTGKSLKGVEQKMGAIAAHNCYYSFEIMEN